MRDEIRWGRTLIRYHYEFRGRTTLAIHVHPDLSVTVVAPHGTALQEIRQKVHKRGAWIRRAWGEFRLYLPKQPPRSYVNGEAHRYLGRQYRLKAEQGAADDVKCLRGRLCVTTRTPPSPLGVARLLDSWYRGRAHTVFQERLDTLMPLAQRQGIDRPPLTIRSLKMRWGSCTRTGRIILNQELIKTPKDCIDYVLAHELCHLKEPHHGPAFWRLLARIMPDYDERRARLNLFADI